MSMIKVCDVQDVESGEMKSVEAEGLPPLAIYNVDGQFFATSSFCTHSVALLTDGYLEGEIVECPLHGGCFNVRTGRATKFPCEKPLQTFKVVVDGTAVLVEAP